MKKIILKDITLLNFKGARNEHYEFNDAITSFAGRNGTGKSTIFDAFTWLLFGKDSLDRKQFQLKTIDKATRKVISKLPHEVSATLLVDGITIVLKRRFNEKWVKPRGSMEEKFEGHTEERLYNDVPCSVREWSDKINAICSEELFKLITNPFYFVNLRSDVQREMLVNYAGVEDDTLKDSEDYKEIFDKLNAEHKTLDEYKRELKTKHSKTVSEVEAIPQRIDERQREISALKDNFTEIEEELNTKNSRLKGLNDSITDASKSPFAKQISDLQSKISSRESAIRKEVQSDNNKLQDDKWSKESDIRKCERDIATIESSIKNLDDQISDSNAQKSKLSAEWEKLQASTFVLDNKELSCPTCGRAYDEETLADKEDKLREQFNVNRAESIKDNVAKGTLLKEKIEELKALKQDKEQELGTLKQQLEKYKNDAVFSKNPKNADELIKNDAEISSLQEEISKLNEEASKEDLSNIKAERDSLQEEISKLNTRLSKRDDIKRNEERIEELQESQRTLFNERASIEHVLYVIKQYEKARIEQITDKINAMFQYVTFKMFDTQVNGEVVETCEVTVDGVPYSVLNNADKINAGLEIIRVISEKKGVSAPIFIDNAESIIEPISTGGQQIRLYVSNCEFTQLTESFY